MKRIMYVEPGIVEVMAVAQNGVVRRGVMSCIAAAERFAAMVESGEYPGNGLFKKPLCGCG